jgi:hypothetical protein
MNETWDSSESTHDPNGVEEREGQYGEESLHQKSGCNTTRLSTRPRAHNYYLWLLDWHLKMGIGKWALI